MKWVREAISDEVGQADMAYVAIGFLTMAAIGALSFIFIMSSISYARCQPFATTTIKGEQSVTSVVPCNFDPLPVGQSAGLIFGAFGALIGALAGYMAATRKQRPAQQGDQNIYSSSIGHVEQPQPAVVPAKPAKPKPRGRK